MPHGGFHPGGTDIISILTPPSVPKGARFPSPDPLVLPGPTSDPTAFLPRFFPPPVPSPAPPPSSAPSPSFSPDRPFPTVPVPSFTPAAGLLTGLGVPGSLAATPTVASFLPAERRAGGAGLPLGPPGAPTAPLSASDQFALQLIERLNQLEAAQRASTGGGGRAFGPPAGIGVGTPFFRGFTFGGGTTPGLVAGLAPLAFRGGDLFQGGPFGSGGGFGPLSQGGGGFAAGLGGGGGFGQGEGLGLQGARALSVIV